MILVCCYQYLNLQPSLLLYCYLFIWVNIILLLFSIAGLSSWIPISDLSGYKYWLGQVKFGGTDPISANCRCFEFSFENQNRAWCRRTWPCQVLSSPIILSQPPLRNYGQFCQMFIYIVSHCLDSGSMIGPKWKRAFLFYRRLSYNGTRERK